jgi:hypothetical protein
MQQYELQHQQQQASRVSWFHRPAPPAGTATLGRVAYYALGDIGLMVLDIMLLLLLSGIVVAYEVAILAFSRGTPFTTGNNFVDAIILAILLVPLCMVDDMSNLSKLSHLGLVILGFAIVVIAGYGISGYDYENDFNPFHVFPPNGLTGVSHWFGCVVFGFGIVPLTFNFRESMAEPEQLPMTALISMLLVAVSYIVTGIVLLFLYPHIQDDVLSEIPDGGVASVATVTRLAMIVVVMATAPLLIVPCAEIVEGKIHHDGQVHPKTILLARSGISLVTVSISVMLPGFVSVLAFVGCFSVALVSFCVPPFLHLVLLYEQQRQTQNQQPLLSYVVDVACLLSGVVTTVVTTSFTFRKLIEK